MRRFELPEPTVPYVEALRRLISTGVSSSPTLEDSPLVDLPIVVKKAGAEAPRAVRAQAFIELLEWIADERLMGKDSKTARILFALGEFAGMPARVRYEEVARLHNHDWSWWETSYRKEPLTRHLYAVYIALHREGERASFVATPSARGVEVDAERHQSTRPRNAVDGGDWILNRYESIYNFPQEPGQPREFLQTREITASSDGLESWRYASRWGYKNPEEVPELTLFGPGELQFTHKGSVPYTNDNVRIYAVELRFPKPLKAGDTFRFGLLKRHRARFEELVRPDWIDHCGLTSLAVPTERATVGVRFPRSRPPRTVWHFEDLPEWMIPGVATEANRLTIDSSSFASFSWHDLFIGYSYGLAWEW